MRKLIAPFAALAFLATAGSALAAEKSGKIIKIDTGRDQIQVDNLTILIEGIKLDGLKEGDTVKVEYHYDDLGYHLQSIKKE